MSMWNGQVKRHRASLRVPIAVVQPSTLTAVALPTLQSLLVDPYSGISGYLRMMLFGVSAFCVFAPWRVRHYYYWCGVQTTGSGVLVGLEPCCYG